MKTNPFLSDLIALTDSPRYSSGEHRIAFTDDKNDIEGHTYGKTLNMAIARAEYAANAINQHAALANMLMRLTEKVNRAYAIQFVGGRVKVEDWAELDGLTDESQAILSRLS